MTPYEFHPEAEAEFIEATHYFGSRSPGLGRSFVDAVEQAVHVVRQYPSVGTPVWGARRLLVRGFPYGVVYLYQHDRIIVLAVAHLRRRPGYWRHRP